MALTNLINFTKRLEAYDFADEQDKIIRTDQSKDLLAQSQRKVLSEGKDKTGKVRNDEYAPLTKRLKAQYGHNSLSRVTDIVTFYDTSELYQSLYTEFSGKTFQVTSNIGLKWDKMITRIGEPNYGIDPQRIEKYKIEYLKPEVLKTIPKP